MKLLKLMVVVATMMFSVQALAAVGPMAKNDIPGGVLICQAKAQKHADSQASKSADSGSSHAEDVISAN